MDARGRAVPGAVAEGRVRGYPLSYILLHANWQRGIVPLPDSTEPALSIDTPGRPEKPLLVATNGARPQSLTLLDSIGLSP